MQEAYEIAQERAQKSADRGKRTYDNKVSSSVLEEGDRVIVNMTRRGGTGKLRSHWEHCIYKVVRQVNKDFPIYEVVPEQGKKKRDSRILHRNLLLPCNYLPVCYSIGRPAHPQCLHQVLPRERQRAGPQWRNSVSLLRHQPVLRHGY